MSIQDVAQKAKDLATTPTGMLATKVAVIGVTIAATALVIRAIEKKD